MTDARRFNSEQADLEQARRAASQALADPDLDLMSVSSVEEDAEHLKVRVQLMMSLRRFIEASGMTQHEAAGFFGIAQPRISNLVNLKTDQFSADLLIDLHARAGMTVRVDVKYEVETAKGST
jgi:predicted XRE-type DNA-binding protein